MFKWIRNLKVAYKLGLIAVLMGIPVVVLSFLFWRARNQEIAAMQKQLDSLDYLGPLHRLQQHTLLHSGLIYIVLSDPTYRPQLAGDETDVEADLAELQKVDTRLGQAFGTTETLSRIRREWQEIREKAATFSIRQMYDAHTRMNADILSLIRLVGDNAVVLDSSLDTYYLGNCLLLQIPYAAEYLGQLRYTGSEVLIGGAMSPNQRAQLIEIIANLHRFSAPKSGGIQVSLATAGRINPRLDDRLRSSLTSATNAAEAFVQSAENNVMGGKVTASLRDYFAVATDSIASVFRLYDSIDDVYRTELDRRISDTNQSKYLQLGLGILVLMVAIMLVWLVSRGIARQIGAMTNLFSLIGIGHFTSRAEVYSNDEIGAATASLNSMLDNLVSLIQSREERDRIQNSIHKLLEEIGGLAEGDLTTEAEVTAEITGAIADAFNNMTAELRNVISTVHDTTLAVSSSATEVQTTAEHLATGSEAQASQIVDATAAIDEMAVSIQQVSENAVAAAGVADTALRNAKQGADAVLKTIDGMNGIRQQVQQTAKRIKRLGESSQEIGEIVQLINDIAERTSTLALNASIQAAMAGDAGRGFAVVAEQVERLADHSTDATKKITALIKSIQADTNEAITAMEETTVEVINESTLANEAGARLSDIEKISTQLAELIQSISLASKQQSRGSEGVAKSMADISQVTQQTAAGAKQAAVSIRKLAQLADDLRSSLRRFKLPEAA